MDCGRKCSPTPSPHRSPVTLPEPAELSFNYSDRTNQIHLIQISTIAVASTVAMVFLLYSLLKILGNYYSRRFHNSRRSRNSPILFDVHGDSSFSDDESPPAPINHPVWFINTVGLRQSVIDSIAVCRYRRGEGIVEVTECSVCLSEFQEDESVRLLPKCSHAFHVSCIDTWLRSHKNCPLCRAPIVREASSGRSDSEVVTALDSVEIRTTEIVDGVGGGESSEVRVEDDDDDGDDFSVMMPTEDGEDSEVLDKNMVNSSHKMEKMNCHSARASRSDSRNSS